MENMTLLLNTTAEIVANGTVATFNYSIYLIGDRILNIAANPVENVVGAFQIF